MAVIQSVRWENFRSFTDSGVIDIAPLTIIVGANASGKTSLIAPLLLLKQTLESTDKALPLKSKGRYFNAGTYRDLVFAHELKRSVRLELNWRDSTQDNASTSPLRLAPPGSLRLGFDGEKFGTETRLSSWQLRDSSARLLIERRRNREGEYSLSGVELGDATDGWSQSIRASRPEGFLFTPASVLASKYHRPVSGVARKARASDSLSAEHNFYLAATGYATVQIQQLLQGIDYLGPLRDPPRRTYESAGESPHSVGAGGQFAPELILRASSELLARINHWVERFEFGRRIVAKRHGDATFSLTLARSKNSTSVNVADTGFGFSQVLPLIVQSLLAVPGHLLIAEQPEIHLNPRLQSLLADLFVDVANQSSKVLIETHSEHLVLRVRRLIAEKRISSDSVALYFAERSQGASLLRRIPIGGNGHIERQAWPTGFFEDGLREALGLASAQAKARNAE